MNFRFQHSPAIAVYLAAAAITLGAIRATKTLSTAPLQKAVAATDGTRFEDVTRAAGIHFVHYNGAFGKKWLPETMGPGVAFIDYDNDGWQDVLIVNGMARPGHARKHLRRSRSTIIITTEPSPT